MQDGQGRSEAILGKRTIDRKLADTNLTIGQKDAVNLICTSKDRVVGVQGTAGTGKTTMLKTVKEIAAERGIEMVGLAPTKAASQVFAESVEIESKTLQSFVMQYDGVAKGRGMKEEIASMQEDFSNKLIILDEASLASSKDMKSLLKISERLDFKVVITGDRKQQQAVETGKPFYYMQDHGMNTAIQRDVVRQEPNSDLLKAIYVSEKAVDSEV
jgi:ATP-dependent exoDNAse (exonuclease V) alpha subunit